MSNWPQLARAPIVEGLIDIRVAPSPDVTFSAIKSACDDLAAEFPSRLDMFQRQVDIHLTENAPPNVSESMKKPHGVRLSSVDEKFIAQFRLDGFTLSRLHPYATWDELKAKSKTLWEQYRVAAKPVTITRVAVRFINRIPLPKGQSFEQTFSTTFTISTSLPQSVAGFLLRVVVPFEAAQCVAIISQTLDADGAHCIFDLDVFSERADGFSEEDAWEQIEVLRKVKNEVFFGSLTPQAVESFK